MVVVKVRKGFSRAEGGTTGSKAVEDYVCREGKK